MKMGNAGVNLPPTTLAWRDRDAVGAEHAGRLELPPALLTDASWYGTLAAARDLGAHGVPVTLASDRLLAPARWSRHVARTERCPPATDAPRFLEWLHRFSAREPGHVYYPTSDDTAWLVCAHEASLRGNLRLHLPSLGALASLLDKSLLAEAASAAGVPTPQTWCPRDEAEVERLSRDLAFPVIVKPRTQVLARGAKGVRVHRREELASVWRARRQSIHVDLAVLRHLRDADLPLVQACHSGTESIYTLDGFVADGALVTRACTKLLQLPRGSGPGIAFMSSAVDPAVSAGMERLFRQVGYSGVFDAEFVADGERLLLIDVNPRFYNHMAFEIERGMPLAWLAYLASTGETEALRGALRDAEREPVNSTRVYVHRRSLGLLLPFQRLSGAMSAAEVRSWRRWTAAHAGEITDPSSSEGDNLARIADVALIAQRLLRHPRSSVRDLVRAGSSERPPSAPANGGPMT